MTCSAASTAMRQATTAVLDGDAERAEQVIAGDAELDDRSTSCEQDALRLLALQAPVTGDRGTVLALLYSGVKIERMAAHIAETVRFASPQAPVPEQLCGDIRARVSSPLASATASPC